MNITVEKNTCSATVNVEVPADKVASERESIVKAYSNQAKIKGFRPGKAPVSIVEKRYATEITEELTSRLVNEGCQEAIKSEDLKVLSVKNPQDIDFKEDGTLTFSTSVILAPEFELPEYKGIEIEGQSEEVTDEDIDKSLEDLRARFADFKDVEREVAEGDFAIINFSATTDGKPVAEAIGKPAGFLEGREGHWVKVEEDSFLTGFPLQLVGLKQDDKKDITITLNDEFPITELRGAEVTFDVTVTGVKEQELPELNDEFAGKLIPEKGLEELKEVITQQLEQEKKRNAADAKVNQIVEFLNEAVEFELPEELVQAETQGNANQMAQRGFQQGMTEEQINEQQDEIMEAAEKQARTNLKTNFILQEIAFKEEIKVEDQDVLQRIHQLAQQAQKPVKKYIKELQKANAIQNVRNSVLIGKTIDFLVDNAKVSGTTEKETETADA
ncbi:trigger factor [Rubritalea squalenifaciens DSM 18772]|uniref:Trigger factor n=1 Tax=Rubritalea squalenifaciens DSM 18772 TaxID=1123071 RepID=A0A1M6M1A6_9BACT|nr:trigger factor [Rubritalea squalenifaciens]SHJ77166.1 trigger factor [Rubritalea squalenifaciens DSM 18772]